MLCTDFNVGVGYSRTRNRTLPGPTAKAGDGLQGIADGAFGGDMGHDHQRHGPARFFGRFVLDHRSDRDLWRPRMPVMSAITPGRSSTLKRT